MLRTISAAVAALFITTVGASAQTAFPFWVGSAVVDSVTSQCASGGFVAAKNILDTDYRAKTGINGEPNNPGITFYSGRSSYAYFRTGGNANVNTMNGAGTGKGYLIRGNVTTIPNPTQQPYDFTFDFKITPATITQTTQTININGTITNWRNVTGCTVTFRAAYRLGPWQ